MIVCDTGYELSSLKVMSEAGFVQYPDFGQQNSVQDFHTGDGQWAWMIKCEGKTQRTGSR